MGMEEQSPQGKRQQGGQCVREVLRRQEVLLVHQSQQRGRHVDSTPPKGL